MRFKVAHFSTVSLSKCLARCPEFNLPHSISSTAVLHTHFSSIPDRPLRGERRGDRSRDFPRKDFNLEDDGGRSTRDDARQNSSSGFANRPLRGDRGLGRPDCRSSLEADGNIQGFGRARSAEQSSAMRMADRPIGKFGGGDERDEVVESVHMDSEEHLPHVTVRDRKEDLRDQYGVGDENHSDQKTPKPLQENSPKASEFPQAASPEPSPQDADEIFRKMKQTGLIPNAVAMLDGLCKDGLVQEAMKLFGLMREKGTIPDVVIYTAVVEGFCKALKFEDAKRVFRKMQTNGITPNAFSYTVFIQGFCKGKQLEDAIAFCIEMLEAGHSPNVATFIGLVDGIHKEKGSEEAQSVIRRLREKGYAFDEKAVKEHLGKKVPYSPPLWEIIFGKKESNRLHRCL
ncbi:hypothetical protein H6P81_000072 [Aristolochia fimbriata]|uniref:Pentatricopeptide repeat-containing protein n=1 Tax=Aristolochia fimbriata TaxID=158543 RepID=A0AAV7F3S9_ARIFI|nr:hypothetical protein H6P81_000072 [Aristolochia fimbriata]